MRPRARACCRAPQAHWKSCGTSPPLRPEARAGAWRSLPTHIHFLAAPWTTRSCRRWQRRLCSVAGAPCGSIFVAWVAVPAPTTMGAVNSTTCLLSSLTARLALAGFSFGAFVACGAVERLHTQRAVAQLVLVGVAAGRFAVAPVPAGLHSQTLLIHGELDDTVPLPAVFDWARPQNLPVTVVPGATHFFHGQLGLLRSVVARHLRTTA